MGSSTEEQIRANEKARNRLNEAVRLITSLGFAYIDERWLPPESTPDPSTGDESEVAWFDEIIDKHIRQVESSPGVSPNARAYGISCMNDVREDIRAALRRSPVDQVSGEPDADGYSWDEVDSAVVVWGEAEYADMHGPNSDSEERESWVKIYGHVVVAAASAWLESTKPARSNGGATAPEEEG